ncbi:MAG: hypothetical protein GX595_20355, partial [Lentisphaerae bacterium]|nr:hypothetical protein [Lentisphaerota bacterium]
MRRPLGTALAAFALAWAGLVARPVAAAEAGAGAARDLWLVGYLAMEEAAVAARDQRLAPARQLYSKALAHFDAVAQRHPDWNPDLVAYRRQYCQEQLRALGGGAPRPPPAPGASEERPGAGAGASAWEPRALAAEAAAEAAARRAEALALSLDRTQREMAAVRSERDDLARQATEARQQAAAAEAAQRLAAAELPGLRRSLTEAAATTAA